MISKKLKARDSYLKRKYGIGLHEYEEMLSEQRFSCAICERHQSNFKNRLAVDHDHSTGRVRGLLCYTCNKWRVGKLNIEWAEKVVIYLKKSG